MDSNHQGTRRRAIVFLLFLYMVINFADKAVLGVVSSYIVQDLNLTASEYGFIASSFFFFFFISGIAVGFLSQRFSSKWIIALLVLIWSLSQVPIMLWPSFGIFVFSRMLLGIGEGPAYPMAVHALYKWYPDRQRNIVTIIIAQGGPIGIIVAVPILAWVAENYGWLYTFYMLSFSGILWLIAWCLIAKEGPLAAEADVLNQQKVVQHIQHKSYKHLILNRTTWGIVLISFVSFWNLALLLTWLPRYLQFNFGLNSFEMSLCLAAVVILSIPVGFAIVIFSQCLINRGYSSRLSRAVLVSLCVVFGGISTLLAMTIEAHFYFFLLLMAFGFALPNIVFSLGPTIVAEIAPVQQRGAMLGIVHALATTAGIFAPWVSGVIIESSQDPFIGYKHIYLLIALLLIVAGILGVILIRPKKSNDGHDPQSLESAN